MPLVDDSGPRKWAGVHSRPGCSEEGERGKLPKQKAGSGWEKAGRCREVATPATRSCCWKLRTCRQIPASLQPLRVRESSLPCLLLLLLAVGARAQTRPQCAHLLRAVGKVQRRRGPGRHLAPRPILACAWCSERAESQPLCKSVHKTLALTAGRVLREPGKLGAKHFSTSCLCDPASLSLRAFLKPFLAHEDQHPQIVVGINKQIWMWGLAQGSLSERFSLLVGRTCRVRMEENQEAPSQILVLILWMTSKHLLSIYYVPSMIRSPRDTAGNKADKNSCLPGTGISVRRDEPQNQFKNLNMIDNNKY